MTRTECLKRLRQIRERLEFVARSEDADAVKMAIEVLERIHEAREAAEKAK